MREDTGLDSRTLGMRFGRAASVRFSRVSGLYGFGFIVRTLRGEPSRIPGNSMPKPDGNENGSGGSGFEEPSRSRNPSEFGGIPRPIVDLVESVKDPLVGAPSDHETSTRIEGVVE